jgi:drug/metabolite transporter (DMT)-like permease
MRKRLRIVCGFLLLFTGAVLALPGVPGPGIVFILLGLLILSDHFVWANKLLQRVKNLKVFGSRGKKPEQPAGPNTVHTT